MSRTSGHSLRGRRGFTLVEILVATSVSAIVFAGILSAYLFMGRNLTRLVNTQQQETQSRRALRQFTQDVSAGTQISVPSTGQLWVTKPTESGTTTVKYVYSSAAGTLTRNEGSDQKILSSVTSLAYVFYSESGATVTSANLQSAKSVELTFASAMGNQNSGTLSRLTTVSPRVVLRNKPILQ